MRVRYGELSSSESLARDGARAQAREAWSLLVEQRTQAARDLVARIDSRLCLHISRLSEPGYAASCFELEATDASAWPLAELILREAPAELSGTLSLGRSPSTLERALAEVLATHGVSLSTSSLRAGFTRGHLLELTLGVRGGRSLEIEQIAAEMLVRRVLGDRLFETWVGAVDAVPVRAGSLRVLDVHGSRVELGVQELFDTVAAAAHGVLSGLPKEPHARLPAGEDWTLLEVEPLADARGIRKEDLLLASTSTPELLRCFLDGAPCSSRRFSRAGETFVYVSYSDAVLPAQQRVERRAQLEERVAKCLAGVGAVTGVGLGLCTTYIDCALCDLDAGLARLIHELRELGLPAQSFVHFFDSELADEWLAIWPHARASAG